MYGCVVMAFHGVSYSKELLKRITQCLMILRSDNFKAAQRVPDDRLG